MLTIHPAIRHVEPVHGQVVYTKEIVAMAIIELGYSTGSLGWSYPELKSGSLKIKMAEWNGRGGGGGYLLL